MVAVGWEAMVRFWICCESRDKKIFWISGVREKSQGWANQSEGFGPEQLAGLTFVHWDVQYCEKSRSYGNKQKFKIGHIKIGMPFGHGSGEVKETKGYMVWGSEGKSRPELYLWKSPVSWPWDWMRSCGRLRLGWEEFLATMCGLDHYKVSVMRRS